MVPHALEMSLRDLGGQGFRKTVRHVLLGVDLLEGNAPALDSVPYPQVSRHGVLLPAEPLPGREGHCSRRVAAALDGELTLLGDDLNLHVDT